MILTLKLDGVFEKTPNLEGILLYFWVEIVLVVLSERLSIYLLIRFNTTRRA